MASAASSGMTEEDRWEKREMEQQIESLKQQVDSLKQVLEITGEPKQSELDEARAGREKAEKRVRELEEQCAKAEASKKQNDIKDEGSAEQVAKLNEKLKAASRRRAQAQAELAQAQGERDEKSKALERMTDQYNESAKALEEAVASLEIKSKTLDDIQASSATLERKSAELETENTALHKTNKEISQELAEVKDRLLAAEDELSSTKEALTKSEKQIEEAQVEHRIASKRSLNMIKELKAQLQKEKANSDSLVEELQVSSKELRAVQDEAEKSSEDLAKTKQALNDAKDALEKERQAAKSRRLPSLKLLGKGNAQAPQGSLPDKDGVKMDLAKRLEQLLNENARLREANEKLGTKVSFLEESAQSFAEELQGLRAKAAAVDDTEVDL